MCGYICRLCGSGSEGNKGFVALEISTSNSRIMICVCRRCRSHLVGTKIIRCQCCGNVWFKKTSDLSEGTRTLLHCSLCNGADMEDVAILDHSDHRRQDNL
jgi:hypothetical protein